MQRCNGGQFCPKSPHIHVRLFQRAAVAGCCHACMPAANKGLYAAKEHCLLKAQILLMFHNIQPLSVCVCVCTESLSAQTPSSLLCSDSSPPYNVPALQSNEGGKKRVNYRRQMQQHEGLFVRGSCLPGKSFPPLLLRNRGPSFRYAPQLIQ